MKTKLAGVKTGRGKRALVAAAVLAGVVLGAQAQNVQIRFRPLTPQDLKRAGLPSSTQKSGGAANVGIGQPVYMEALVQTGTVVTAVNWQILAAPPGSTSTITASPLSNAVPAYDGGDRVSLFVAGRAMIKPDQKSFWDFSGPGSNRDYVIRTEIVLTNKTLSYTNSVYGATFLGQKHYLCVLCHADKQTDFDLTRHATAFTDQITGVPSNHFSANCISCHALGYDTTVGATNNGFDDVAAQVGWTFPGSASPTNWTGMPTNLQHMANVQCEGCHGPASDHMTSGGMSNLVDISLSAGTCGVCHDSLTHHTKVYEWQRSLHSTGYVYRFSGSCMPCHSAKGFIETWDPKYAGTAYIPRATEQEGVTCQACHDPHGPGMGEHQLRAITTATLSNGFVVTEAMAGTGVLCMNCHHSRQSANAVVAGTGSISPHHSTQGDLLLGENGYEYGMQMPSSRHLLAVTNSCLGCHMQLVEGTSYASLNTLVGGHTFRLIYNDASTNIAVTEVCSVCHVEQGTFDFGGEDYDRDGTIEGVQTETLGLLQQIALRLPPVGSTNIVYSSSFTKSQRAAYWNYMYILEDKSLGVHNPKYTAAILQASIDDLDGGIDVDKDGLKDAWEITNFGNLTSQNGSGDADLDGVTNLMEQNAGTNPNLADSDADGVSDLAELQGGTNPLNAASVLDTNVVNVLPAYELTYMPAMGGVTQVFQVINAMGNGGGWQNVGPTFKSSNSPSYQLISLRDTSNRFFRVTTP